MAKLEVHDLKLIADARGWLMECVRSDASWFNGFGQAYVTLCHPGVVKAWHRHLLKTDVFVCIQGMARVVVAEQWQMVHFSEGKVAGQDDTYRTLLDVVVGPLNPKAIVIPAGLWHGFAAVGNEPCLILNVPDRVYDPQDEDRVPWDAIAFNWKGVDG